MFRLILPAVFLGTALSAQDACQFQQDNPENCLRIIGCTFEKDFRQAEEFYFTGTVRGWDGGPVRYVTSTGVTCTGTWLARPPAGSSVAVLMCDDGTSVSVSSYAQSSKDGVVSVRGTDNVGREMAGWVDIAETEAEIYEKTTWYRLTNYRSCAPIALSDR